MRRAQLRLRQIITMTVVALLVVLATVSAAPRQHVLNVAAGAATQQVASLWGRRWF